MLLKGLLVGLFLLGSTAQARIVGISILSDKDLETRIPASGAGGERKSQLKSLIKKRDQLKDSLKKSLIKLGDRLVAEGEVISGIDLSSGKITSEIIELVVPDPARPEAVPYSIDPKSGARTKITPSLLVQVPTVVVEVFGISEQETLASRAADFLLRREAIQALEKQVAAIPKSPTSTRDRLKAQSLLLTKCEALFDWLVAHHYLAASKDAATKIESIRSEWKKGLEQFKGSEVVERRQAFESSLKIEATDPKIAAAGQKAGAEFHVASSKHFKLIFPVTLSGKPAIADEEAKDLLLFSEKVLEGFRVELVDPFSEQDRIPEGIFQVFVFTPPDAGGFKTVATEGLGLPLSDPRMVEMAGMRSYMAQSYLSVNKLLPGLQLRAVIAHQIGHSLADLHYNQGRREGADPQPWLSEAVAFHLSLEYVGHNDVTCVQFVEGGTVAKRGEHKTKEVSSGVEADLHGLALDSKTPFDKLSGTILRDLDKLDTARGWSLFRYLLATQGEKGQRWLKAICDRTNRKSRTDQLSTPVDGHKVRELGAELLGLPIATFFQDLEKQWRTWATKH